MPAGALTRGASPQVLTKPVPRAMLKGLLDKYLPVAPADAPEPLRTQERKLDRRDVSSTASLPSPTASGTGTGAASASQLSALSVDFTEGRQRVHVPTTAASSGGAS